MKFITLFVLFAVGYFAMLSNAYSHDHHHSDQTSTAINTCSGAALSSASGQHNYKSTKALQWSVAGANASGDCDSSAISGGLGLQFGKVFGAVNFSTDFSGNSVIGFSASGAF